MLTQISVTNFALIESLGLELKSGLTMITGETGAGKSILLGALGLIQGKRADLSSVRDNSKKCIVEADFDISKLKLEDFFKSNDLDYDSHTILRREIQPSGKSRAFINDTPVTLSIMSLLGARLIDIHSQHQTLQLATDAFQMEVLDAYVDKKSAKLKRNSAVVRNEYVTVFKNLGHLKARYKKLKSTEAELTKELDYNNHLLNELLDAQLDAIDEKALEEENEQLSNVESITEALAQSDNILTQEDLGVMDQLRAALSELRKISNYNSSYKELGTRLESITLELEDLTNELSRESQNITADPERLSQIDQQLATLNNLYKKHQVDSIPALVELREILDEKVGDTQNLEGNLKKLQAEITKEEENIKQLGIELRELREAYIPDLQKEIIQMVRDLGMPDGQLIVDVQPQEDYTVEGLDKIQFLFTANKGSKLLPLDKAASGGELSRLMLAIKAMLANSKNLPTIIFDEIDTGVSGAISEKMAQIMKSMSNSMQVITITHLPQIAAAGNDHLKVKKAVANDTTVSQISRLNKDERAEEIAQMLSGGTVSDAARENARILLNQY